jgi:hypothetical protein
MNAERGRLAAARDISQEQRETSSTPAAAVRRFHGDRVDSQHRVKPIVGRPLALSGAKPMADRDRPAATQGEAARRRDATEPLKGTTMSPMQTAITHWLPIVRGEFLEVPGLHLSKPQVRRLWGLDPSTCDALLDVLVDGRFLRQTSNGTYARVDASN